MLFVLECNPSCQNTGICTKFVLDETSARCECPQQYVGTYCEEENFSKSRIFMLPIESAN